MLPVSHNLSIVGLATLAISSVDNLKDVAVFFIFEILIGFLSSDVMLYVMLYVLYSIVLYSGRPIIIGQIR